jgi:hypothetical protein
MEHNARSPEQEAWLQRYCVYVLDMEVPYDEAAVAAQPIAPFSSIAICLAIHETGDPYRHVRCVCPSDLLSSKELHAMKLLGSSSTRDFWLENRLSTWHEWEQSNTVDAITLLCIRFHKQAYDTLKHKAYSSGLVDWSASFGKIYTLCESAGSVQSCARLRKCVA